MKNSGRSQKQFYRQLLLVEKKSRELNLLSLEEDGMQIIENEDCDGNIEFFPLPKEFVKLVASSSRHSNPAVF